MSRANWAEHFHNTERPLFKKGRWTLTEDGEQTKSLYFDEDCVESVLEYNKYCLLEKGFILYYNTSSFNSYALYFENHRKPVFTISGKNISVDISRDYITFTEGDNETVFDANSLVQVCINDENQIGLDL